MGAGSEAALVRVRRIVPAISALRRLPDARGDGGGLVVLRFFAIDLPKKTTAQAQVE
jgi:hypothetical protein